MDRFGAEDEGWRDSTDRTFVVTVVFNFKIQAPCRKLIHDAIHKTSKAWGYVFEGYPRTMEQAKDFEEKVSILRASVA